ncbi:MAG: MBOAT family protein [Deltaproteobacteria bacterium]|nr:MBOAT family protein [Deltaproteobacteria bacterium]
MLFNTYKFFLFFAVVYGLYLKLGHKGQNRMLLIASYIFYGSWNWRFLSLILISTIIDYHCGLQIERESTNKRRKLFLIISICSNLGILGIFKYYDFFALSFQRLTNIFGWNIEPIFLNLILPVGISFYTFQTMSYTIDIYFKKMKPTKQFFDFALYVAYFPQLVAGPIERAKHLLPQVLKPRKVTLDLFYQGTFLIFWGIFQKTFIADNLAMIVDPVFDGSKPYNGIQILIALYAFAFQIFCDFAGYSNIARGLSKCMGFDIMVNFNLPYFAKNPSDFWRRWHISLSTWLRDYLYIPLGGNKKGTLVTYRNLFITMFLGGLWHGAAATFVVWGIYHGALLIIHRLFKPFFDGLDRLRKLFTKPGWEGIKIVFFFHVVAIGWLFFRANSVGDALEMMHALLFNFRWESDLDIGFNLRYLIFFTWILLFVQWFQYKRTDLMVVYKAHPVVRTAFYSATALLLFIFGVIHGNAFIYFQF